MTTITSEYTLVVVDTLQRGTHVVLVEAISRDQAVGMLLRSLCSDDVTHEQAVQRFLLIGARQGDHRATANSFLGPIPGDTNDFWGKDDEAKTH